LTFKQDGIGGDDPRTHATAQRGNSLAQRIVAKIAERVRDALGEIGR